MKILKKFSRLIPIIYFYLFLPLLVHRPFPDDTKLLWDDLASSSLGLFVLFNQRHITVLAKNADIARDPDHSFGKGDCPIIHLTASNDCKNPTISTNFSPGPNYPRLPNPILITKISLLRMC